MNTNPFRQNEDELRELLLQFNNMKLGLAHTFFEEDDFEKIIDYFDENEQLFNAVDAADYAIDQYPFSANLLLIKANFLIATKKYKEALSFLNKSELLDTNNINLYILKTDAYLALDKHDNAAVVLDNAINNFEGKEKIDLLFELADVYDDYENFDIVFDCLKIILAINPNEEEALHKICFWTDFTGRNEESIKISQGIIEAFPFNELAWFNLGAAFQGIKLYEKAIDAYLYAVAINDKFDYAYRNMGDAYLKLKRYNDAIEVLLRVLELSTPEEVIYEAIGHSYDKMHNYEQARFYYRKATLLNPENSELFYKIACTYMNGFAWENAIKNLQTAMRIYKMQPEYNLALGQCYMELGDAESAVQFFGNVVRHKPKNNNGWIELLKCLYKSNCLEEGIEFVEHAIILTNHKPIFYIYKAAFLFGLGKSKEALLQLEAGLKKNPKLFKKFVALNPAALQNQQVVAVAAQYKKGKTV